MRSLAIALALVSGSVRGDGAAPAKACAAPEHRQFDFWVGTWDVTARGKPAGTNRIERILGGCALQEHWTGKESRGTSLNSWDPARRRWTQLWIDDTGLVLRLEGGLADGSMVLAGDAPDASGRSARHRITWTPLPDGKVRQRWETSDDGAMTWKTVFDGTYARAG